MSLSEYNYRLTTKDTSQEWDATEYKILHRDSGTATFSRDASQATITYIVEYAQYFRFIDVVLGKTVKGSGGLVRSATSPDFDSSNGSLPEPHPYVENFYASSADVRPIGIAENTALGPIWNKAAVTVVFRPLPYLVLSDSEVSGDDPAELFRFVSVQTTANAEFLTSEGSFTFVTSGTKLATAPGQTVAAFKKFYTWHQVPIANENNLADPPNIDTIIGLLGKINSVEFDGFGPGSVLFSDCSWKLPLPQTASAGGRYWDIAYTFGIRDNGASAIAGEPAGSRVGWNYVYDPVAKAWDLVTTDGTAGGGRLYKDGDLNDLFRVTW